MIMTGCYIRTMEKETPRETPFGAALRFLRKNAGLTQPELARILNVSQATITKLETGKIDGKVETRDLVFKWAGLSHDEFMEVGKSQLPEKNNILQKNILDDFSDKAAAESIMKDLAYIERTSPRLFYEVAKRIGWEKADLEDTIKKRGPGTRTA